METLTVKTDAGGAAKVVTNALDEIHEIASLPEIAFRIIEIVRDPQCTARDLHDAVRTDAALASRILKVVNSGAYALPVRITLVDRATILLGLPVVKDIAVAVSLSPLFQGGAAVDGISGLELWRHSAAVGAACRMIAQEQDIPCQEEVYLAGLIHDLGLLIMLQALPRKLAEVIARHRAAPKSFRQIEEELVGADHQAFGQALAAKWHFPRATCAVIGHHHEPHALAAEFRPMGEIVHVADLIACMSGIGFSMTASHEELTPAVLDGVGLDPADITKIQIELSEHVRAAEVLVQN